MKFSAFFLFVIIVLLNFDARSYAHESFVKSSMYDSTEAFFDEGVKELEKKNYDKAVNLFSKYLAIHDLDEVAFIQRGNAYYGLKMYKEAMADYETAGKIGYNNPEVPYRIGMVQAVLKDYDAAETSQLKAIKLDEAFAPAYEQLGDIEMFRNKPETAIQYYEKSMAIDSTKDIVLYKVGEIYLSQNKHEEALAYLTSAINQKPNNPDYYYLAGMVYYSMHDTANTITYLEKSTSISPTYAAGFYTLAHIYRDHGRYKDAVDTYTKSIEISKTSPSQNVLYTERGTAYVKMLDYDNAMKDFEYAMKLNPADTLAYIHRGEVYLLQGKDSLAFLDFNKGLSLDKDNVTGLVNRGIIFLTMSQYDVAEKDLVRAIELSPRNTKALYALANALLEQDKSQEAIKYYDKTLSADPGFKIVYENRGIAYYNLGFYRQAMADFEAAMKYDETLTKKLQPLYQDAKSKAGM
jgi:tetratricopeptide (TPR) repeat protein